jgi:hypothetical protein
MSTDWAHVNAEIDDLGIASIGSGRRRTLGVIFHDAC